MAEVVNHIETYLSQEPDASYRLVIGSDSHERVLKGRKIANYITAIVVHRVGKGGRYFWKNGLKQQVNSLRQKIYQETILSLDLAKYLVPQINKKLKNHNNWDLEIHIDIGPSGDTRTMIKEIVGMVAGYGYKASIKPDSFAASKVADKHT